MDAIELKRRLMSHYGRLSAMLDDIHQKQMISTTADDIHLMSLIFIQEGKISSVMADYTG
jgi:hypothetical protein